MGTSIYTPDSFPIRNGGADELSQKFVKGKLIASNKSIIIAGLLRNCAKSIPSIKRKIERVGTKFLKYRVLIVENDSTDGTRNELLKWSLENENVTILGCGVNAKQCFMKGSASEQTIGHSVYRSRIEKMVNLRNIYLDYIKKSPELRNFDYTAVWDLDTISMVYIDGIFNTIYELSTEKHQDKSAVCAHGIYRWMGILPLYYDTYAHLDYTDNFHISNKLSHDIRKGFTNGIGYKRGEHLVPVRSCFSGFTIYRTSDILNENVRYSITPETTDNNLECEHVRLHDTLPRKIAMNPSMINLVLFNE